MAPAHGYFIPRRAFADGPAFERFVAVALELRRRFGPRAAGAVDRG